MKDMKIKLPLESLITGRIFLQDFGSLEFKGYYGDFLQIVESMNNLFGVDKINIKVDYMEHI